MEVVKAFNSNELHTEIIIKGTIEEPLFRANDIATILEISNIRTTITDFDETEKVLTNSDTLGGNQQVSFLTEKGLYKVLFRSRKPIAEKFQNWVCEVIKEIRLKGQYKLNEEIKELQTNLQNQKSEFEQLEYKKKQEYESNLAKQKIMEREKVLLAEYATIGSIVYIIKVKSFANGQYIIKIGESRKGIQARYREHKHKYEECLLLDCFAVEKSKDFESFIHNNEIVRGNIVKDLPGRENEMELFLIGKNLSYQMLLNMINNNIKYFNNSDSYRLEKEIEKLRLLLEMKNTNNDNVLIEELVKDVKTMCKKIDTLEKSNQDLLARLNTSSSAPETIVTSKPIITAQYQPKLETGFGEPLVTVGPRLQKINPETMEIVKVFETVTEAMKENQALKRPSLNKAVAENMMYCGFRWLFVDRALDSSIIHNLPETKQTKSQNLGYIAQLNADKTAITNVYLDRKTAAQYNGYESLSALDNPVKNFTITKGFYYCLYDNCDDDLKLKFETANDGNEPILYKNGIGQFDATTGKLVREFLCKYECIKSLQMSDKTLAKALTKNVAYNGHHFKEIGAKTAFHLNP